MPARRVNSSYYEDGSTARKILPEKQYTVKKKVNTAKRKRINREQELRRQQAQRKKHATIVAFVLCAFSMSLVITYRFNIINEKNLEVQGLISKLQTISSEVATSQILVDQNTNLEQIEAYAKQQLGMKKADSSQTIYVDTSETINKIQVNQETTIIDKVISYIKGLFL